MIIDTSTLLEGLGGITTLLSAYKGLDFILSKLKKKKEAYRRGILEQAKAEVDVIKRDLELKISALENEFEVQKENVIRDFAHMRESYSFEIKVLGDKINDIRDQLNQQHSQLVSLLTQMIDNK
jgi:chaperonin cofactor prefoldin